MNDTITFVPSPEVEALLKELQDYGFSVQTVINSILKDHLDDYISEQEPPKKKEAE